MQSSLILDQYGQPYSYTARDVPSTSRGGGVRNYGTGLGGRADKSEGTYFTPTLFRSKNMLETIYVESWVAARFIDVPVDDMFAVNRSWDTADDKLKRDLQNLERELGIPRMLATAMKMGRLFGTCLLVIVTSEADLSVPLDISRVKEDGIKNLMVFDRYSASIESWNVDRYSPHFLMPEMYRVYPNAYEVSEIAVHRSRVIRFDGKPPLGTNGWHSYAREWGVSELVPAMTEILNDAALAQAVAHLSQEASLPVISVHGLRDTVSGQTGPDEPTVEELGQSINYFKSVFKTLFIDKSDDFNRVEVNFTGISALMEQYTIRLAAMAGIPVTRFLSRAPGGLNATGDSDMKNYAIHVKAMQRRLLAQPLNLLDQLMARHLGIAELPEYEWPTLIEFSESERMEVSKMKAEIAVMVVEAQLATENEMRERLSGDSFFHNLDPLPEDEFEPDDVVLGMPEAANASEEAGMPESGDTDNGSDTPESGDTDDDSDMSESDDAAEDTDDDTADDNDEEEEDTEGDDEEDDDDTESGQSAGLRDNIASDIAEGIEESMEPAAIIRTVRMRIADIDADSLNDADSKFLDAVNAVMDEYETARERLEALQALLK